MEINVDKELNDYETINGELYLRAKSLAKAIIGSPYEREEMIKEDLGIDENGDII